jgi:hypothetical protein
MACGDHRGHTLGHQSGIISFLFFDFKFSLTGPSFFARARQAGII